MKRSCSLPGFVFLCLIAQGFPAHACDTVDGIMCGLPPPEVAAGEREQLGSPQSARIARILQQTWKFVRAQDFTAARAKLAPVTALTGKTKAEIAAVDTAAAFIAFSLKDFNGAAAAFTDSLDAGVVEAKDVPGRLAVLTQIYFETRDFAKAVSYGDRYTREVGPDSDILAITAQSRYVLKDYTGTVRDIHAALADVANAGAAPKEEWLQVAMSADYYVKDTAATVADLEALVTHYPQRKYWNDLLLYAAQGAVDPLEIYRLRLATGALAVSGRYADMASLALSAGLPGEARTVMDQARAQGLAPETLARDVAAQAADDFKTLASCEADARKQKTGDAEVAAGAAYGSYGENAKAAALIRDGLTRGVADKDTALLSLARVTAASGDTDAALKALADVDAAGPNAQIARLWTIALTHPPGGTQLAAAR